MGRGNGMSIVGGLLLGAAAVYFLDPHAGPRRRAVAVDRMQELLTGVEQRFVHPGTEAGHYRGEVATPPRRYLTPEQILDDRRLEGRVRATLRRLISTPDAVTAETHHGVVILAGEVREDELGYVITGIRQVRGVRRVESRLAVVPRSGRAAQSAPARNRKPPGDSALAGRLVVGSTGVGLFLAGTRRGGGVGFLSAALGGFMLARALLGTSGRLFSDRSGHPGVRVEKQIEVARPIRDVFAFWSNFRNFPHFMRHVREVRETESGISHWVADGPAGVPVSWDAEITALKPHQLLAWKSLDGSTIRNEGEVRFEEVDEQTTRIDVRMTYHPPGGAMGHAVATLFGADPRHQLDDDLERLKSLLERGHLAIPPPDVREPAV